MVCTAGDPSPRRKDRMKYTESKRKRAGYRMHKGVWIMVIRQSNVELRVCRKVERDDYLKM